MLPSPSKGLNIVVAYDRNRGIGYKGGLPWPPIKEDFRHFKQLTMGGHIIMGKNTWFSLPKKPLPGRENYVISALADKKDIDTHLCRSLEQAIKPGAFLIGGGQLYKYALDQNLVERVFASEIDGEYECDTFFPVLDWEEEESVPYEGFTLKIYKNPSL